MRSRNEVQSMNYRVYKVRLLRNTRVQLERWSRIEPKLVSLQAGSVRSAIFFHHLWLVDVGPYLAQFGDEEVEVILTSEEAVRLPIELWSEVPRTRTSYVVAAARDTCRVHEWLNNPLLQLAFSEGL